MDTGKYEEQLHELRSFYMRHGFSEDAFMTSENMDVFVETSVDAYRNYPMFLYVFNGKYDEETLAHFTSENDNSILVEKFAEAYCLVRLDGTLYKYFYDTGETITIE